MPKQPSAVEMAKEAVRSIRELDCTMDWAVYRVTAGYSGRVRRRVEYLVREQLKEEEN